MKRQPLFHQQRLIALILGVLLLGPMSALHAESGNPDDSNANDTGRSAHYVESTWLAADDLRANDAAWKDARWYVFEVVVFLQEGTPNEEVWPADVALSPAPQLLELDPASRFSWREPLSANLLRAWTQLPETLRRLSPTAKRMDDRGMKVLLHWMWYEPVQEREAAVPIYVRNREGRFLLEGEIGVGINRYLHADMDLLLDELTANPAQALHRSADGRWLSPKQWQIPALPMAASTAAPASALASDDNDGSGQSVMDSGDEVPASAIRDTVAANTEVPASEPVIIDYDEKGEPLYLKQRYLLRESRRMKSGELHYLDHPRFGVLVKSWPMDADTLNQLNEKLFSSSNR